MAAKKSDQHSVKSTVPSESASSASSSLSSLSRKAASVKRAITKGAKAITRPFKTAKKALSMRTRSSVDASSTADGPDTVDDASQVIELSDDDADPEKVLGTFRHCCDALVADNDF